MTVYQPNNLPYSVSVEPPSFIQPAISLRDKNWFATGGPARYFCEPMTIEELRQAYAWAQAHDIPTVVIGLGANVLISDEGFPGLVIRLGMKECTLIDRQADTVLVRAQAGCTLDALITWCLDRAVGGLEEFSGIPSTVGGAVFINLHYFEFLLSDFLVSATILHTLTGVIQEVPASWFQFGYNKSALQQSPYLVLDATFALRSLAPLQTSYARGRSDEIKRHRVKRYPSSGTCGSFFRNFYPHEVSLESNGKKMIYIAYYLDKLGLKGELRKGGCSVSYQHANMLVNDGTATSDDIIHVARAMQQRVVDTFHIVPQPECQLIGFSTYPLL